VQTVLSDISSTQNASHATVISMEVMVSHVTLMADVSAKRTLTEKSAGNAKRATTTTLPVKNVTVILQEW